jgi:caffeoyl-CoA O-methyltransferase
MHWLEERDRHDRLDDTPRSLRLRQIPPETGRFLAILAAAAPNGKMIEVGTSGGYSGLWLALACRTLGRRLTTFEWDPAKATLATETFRLAEVEDVVEIVEADARTRLPDLGPIGFCFLDAEKEFYAECYEAVIPVLAPGGLLVADNAISHESALRPMLERALVDTRVDAVIVPIGRGELVCRRT